MRHRLAFINAALLALLAAVSLPVAGAAAADEALACKRVEMLDGDSGKAVQGAEDLALDREAGRLFISAYDRWAVEDAAQANARTLPQGGIYAVTLAEIAEAGDSLEVRNLTRGVEGAMQPHGIGLYHGGERRRLFAVNHAYARDHGEWRKQTRIDIFEVEGEALEAIGRIGGESLCNANDVAPISGESALVTRDRAACGGPSRVLETMAGLRRAEVMLVELSAQGERQTVEMLLDGIGFANGIALSPNGRSLAVAATREQAVHFHDLPALLNGQESRTARVSVPGGPDNLNWGTDGRLLAAVHPSLMRSGIARHQWFGRDRAGSRLVVIDPEQSGSRTLVDDPEGHSLNMATSVVEAETMLIASGVLDSALLVCRPHG